MADAEPIVQEVVLKGIDEAVAQLGQLAAAATALGQTFSNIGEGGKDPGKNAHEAGEKTEKAGAQAKEAAAHFAELGEKGTQTFEGLTRSSEGFISSFSQLSTGGAIAAFEGLIGTAQRAAGTIPVVGQAVGMLVGAFGAAAAGTAAVTYGLKELAAESAHSIAAIDNLAKEAGSTFESIYGLRSVFSDAGVGAAQFEQAMRIAAVRIRAEWPAVSRAVRDASDQILSDQIKIIESTTALAGAQDQVKSSYIAVEQAAINMAAADDKAAESSIKVKESKLALLDAQTNLRYSYLATQSAQLSLDHAEYNLALANGARRDKDYEQYLKIQDAELAVAEAKKRVSEASHQRERDELAEQQARINVRNAEREEERQQLEGEKALLEFRNAQRTASEANLRTETLQLERRAAQRKLEDDRLKDPKGISETIQRSVEGQADAQKDVNLQLVETHDLYRSILVRASQMRDEKGNLLGLTPETTIYAMADAFKALGNSAEAGAQKIALVREYGRGLGQEFVNAIGTNAEALAGKQGEVARSKAVQQLKDQVAAAREFNVAQSQMNEELEKTVTLAGATLFPGFIEGFKKFATSLDENRDKTIDWVKSLTTVQNIIRDVFSVLSGEQPEKGGWVDAIVKGFEGAKASVDAMVAGITKIADLAQRIADTPWVKAMFPGAPKEEPPPVGAEGARETRGGREPEEARRPVAGVGGPEYPQIVPYERPSRPGGYPEEAPVGTFGPWGDTIASWFNTRPRTPGTAETLPGLTPVETPLTSGRQPQPTDRPVPVTIVGVGAGAPTGKPEEPSTPKTTGGPGAEWRSPANAWIDLILRSMGGGGETKQSPAVSGDPGNKMDQAGDKQKSAGDTMKGAADRFADAVNKKGGGGGGPTSGGGGGEGGEKAKQGSEPSPPQHYGLNERQWSAAVERAKNFGVTAEDIIFNRDPQQDWYASHRALDIAEQRQQRPPSPSIDVHPPPRADYTSSDDDSGYALGGLIRGPGSGTSDSVLARFDSGGAIRVSDGEFIAKQASVQHYGLPFMNAVNDMKLPKFAEGGLIGAGFSIEHMVTGLPGYAAGGKVASKESGRGLTLVLDHQTYSDLTGPSHVVDQLERHALSRRVASTGRKPSWME